MSLRNKIVGLKEILSFDNWLNIILQTVFKPKANVFIYNLNGKEFILNKKAGDIPGFRSIITSNEYRPYLNELKFIDSITLVDLGANIGGFPVLLDSMNIKIKKLIAVEFNTNTFYRLSINISNNFNCEYHLLNRAIVGYERSVPAIDSLGGTSNNIYSNEINLKNCSQIMGNTFDQIYNEFFENENKIDILKVDIEGAEYEMFEYNTFKTITNCKYIIIEIHTIKGKNKENVLKKLHELHFKNVVFDNTDNKDVYLFKNLDLL